MSGQKDVDKQRVRLTHTVEESGAMQDVEIPFVMGVVTDAYGNHPESEKVDFDNAEFKEVNSNTFDSYLSDTKPRMQITVPNHLSDNPDEMMVADITINSMSDFSPDAVVKQVDGLKEVYEARRKLELLLLHMESSRSAKKILDEGLAAGNLDSLLEALSSVPDAKTDGGEK